MQIGRATRESCKVTLGYASKLCIKTRTLTPFKSILCSSHADGLAPRESCRVTATGGCRVTSTGRTSGDPSGLSCAFGRRSMARELYRNASDRSTASSLNVSLRPAAMEYTYTVQLQEIDASSRIRQSESSVLQLVRSSFVEVSRVTHKHIRAYLQ